MISRRGLVTGACALVLAGTVAAIALSTGGSGRSLCPPLWATGTTTLSPALRARVRTAMHNEFVYYSASGVEQACFVRSTRSRAVAAAVGGGSPYGNPEPVILVAVTGHFSVGPTSPVDRAQEITGSVLTFTVDASPQVNPALGFVQDSGISNNRPNLSVLGQVQSIPVASGRP